jgi:glycerol-3-phosphate O-acyltransferase
MREPRLGVLDYMLRGFRRDGERDLVFVPLGINYDRVLEDRTLISPTKIGRARTIWETLRFLVHNLRLALKSEWHRFGYACVNFGTPISMRRHDVDFQRLSGEERRLAVARLGRTLMDAVGRVVPVVPVALIAHIFLARRSLTALDLKAETGRLLQRLEGAHVYVPRRDLDYALTVGLRMLTLRRLVEEREGVFSAREEELPLLRYYANSIAHLLHAPDGEIR